jgi:hypothetical protein
MKIAIEIDKESIIHSCSEYLKNTIKFLYKWLTNEGEALGYILGYIHFMLFMLLMVSILISHTIYPNFWFKLVILITIVLVWLQHIFLRVCVSIVAEKDLTNSTSPFHDLLENVFHISTTDFTNYFIVAETIAILCFTLEIICRMSLHLHGYRHQA